MIPEGIFTGTPAMFASRYNVSLYVKPNKERVKKIINVYEDLRRTKLVGKLLKVDQGWYYTNTPTDDDVALVQKYIQTPEGRAKLERELGPIRGPLLKALSGSEMDHFIKQLEAELQGQGPGIEFKPYEDEDERGRGINIYKKNRRVATVSRYDRASSWTVSTALDSRTGFVSVRAIINYLVINKLL